MNKRLTKKAKETFESIKKIDENGTEYWTARELAKALEYADYRNFVTVARKAWFACKNSGFDPNYQFVAFTELIIAGKGAERQIDNIKMTRYACYLCVQNADPTKPLVAQAQSKYP